MEKYNHQKIEKKWQMTWEGKKIWETKEGKSKKFYVLDMYPYPSAEGLHVGHPEGYTASDIVARYLRMNGYNVLHPMGWDAFGLPAENYAIKTGIHPKVSIEKNIKKMKSQIKSLGFSYDWSREINTTDPDYYKWTQWIFLQMFKKGLAYEALSPINWCPSCKTGLANEEVVNGRCERCKTEVTKKNVRQWLLKITKYADRLLKGLDKLDWPEPIKLLQRNWIGRSEGTIVKFQTPNSKQIPQPEACARGASASGGDPPLAENSKFEIEVFTTRPDTLFGATYMVLSPEHPLVEKITTEKQKKAVEDYIKKAKAKSDLERTDLAKEKTGVFTGAYAINPVNNKEIPIWMADYVLISYGTGAIMAVPAHDERDYEFAKKYKLLIIQVITPLFENKSDLVLRQDKPMAARRVVNCIVRDPKNNTYLCQSWKKQPWKAFVSGSVENNEDIIAAAKREILEETGYKHLKFIKILEWEVHVSFFAPHKDENRYARVNTVVFDLERDTQDPVRDSELKQHQYVWLPKNKVREFLSYENLKYIWDLYENPSPYTGEGVMINSEQFNGLSSKEGIKKITKWLEENKLGRKAVNYKLRDWVFSRQRYWGEPIPVVHCENCKKNNKPIVWIIHGSPSCDKSQDSSYTGEENQHWIPWLKKRLEEKGIVIYSPRMPRAWQPDYREWKKEVEKLEINENSILIGHSAGGAFLPRWLGEAKKKINKLILVVPGKTAVEDNKRLHDFYNFKIDETIKERVNEIIVYIFDNEKDYRKKSADLYSKLLNGRLIMLENKGHFTLNDMETEEFPELLNEINFLPVGVVPVPEKDLPVKLPEVKNYKPTGTGESPLANIKEWVNVKCPKCGSLAKRETNTMPQWAGSCWYYLRYLDPKNKKELVSKEKEKYWMAKNGVDLYVGGAEHAVLHLLYARFWHMFLYDIGVVSTPEPFYKLKNQGIILGEDNQKMSKSRGNVINPDDVIKEFGADSMRMYEMFIGPFEDVKPWSTKGLVGMYRFLDRIWKVLNKIIEEKDKLKIVNNSSKSIHRTIKKVTEDIENFKFNTAISELMIFFNERDWASKLNKNGEFENGSVDFKAAEKFLILLSPFAPHLSEELWQRVGHKKGIAFEKWPAYDPKMIKEEEIELVVQVNGKLRDRIKVKADISEEEAKKMALTSEKVKKYVKGEPRKIIFVKGRLINFVI